MGHPADQIFGTPEVPAKWISVAIIIEENSNSRGPNLKLADTQPIKEEGSMISLKCDIYHSSLSQDSEGSYCVA